MTFSSEIIKFATSKNKPFTRKELQEFLMASRKDISTGTLHVLLNRLLENGKLAKIGRGLFSLSSNTKPQFVYIPSEAESTMAAALKRKFPFVKCCVWKANAITPFMHHVPSMSFMLVDVERIAMEPVFQFLQSQYPKSMILLNPSHSDCDRYLNMDNIIVVRPLIVETPLSSHQGTNTPSIEKILVDIVADKEFDYAGGAELFHIYTNAFETVDVNQKKLLRYASRRNRKKRIEQILKSSNL
ncbi:MAG: hypothetical protein MJZ63_01640 [Muribaculaceae bacterium]|nr:hypothetical protein [Muribaculaceae bacterium]